MKNLIRSYHLSVLMDIPLTANLIKIEESINLIQVALNKFMLTVYRDNFPKTEVYIFGTSENLDGSLNYKVFLKYNVEQTDVCFVDDDFFQILETKYKYNFNDIRDLIEFVTNNYFNNMVFCD